MIHKPYSLMLILFVQFSVSHLHIFRRRIIVFFSSRFSLKCSLKTASLLVLVVECLYVWVSRKFPRFSRMYFEISSLIIRQRIVFIIRKLNLNDPKKMMCGRGERKMHYNLWVFICLVLLFESALQIVLRYRTGLWCLETIYHEWIYPSHQVHCSVRVLCMGLWLTDTEKGKIPVRFSQISTWLQHWLQQNYKRWRWLYFMVKTVRLSAFHTGLFFGKTIYHCEGKVGGRQIHF